MSCPICRLLAHFALLFSALTAGAQGTWNLIPAPTTQELWGVCHGGDQFVAVGGGGTILTSPDGSAWTARTSGTTEWLLAVTHGSELYVAVGDHGTILTSPDAVTWTPRAAGGPRLNGVAFGGGRFLAVGENGATSTSLDGITWQWGNAGVTTFLRGIVFARDQFIVSGGAGTLLATKDAIHFARLGIATTGAVEALAWDGEVFAAGGEFNCTAHAVDPRAWTFDTFDYGPDVSYWRGVAFFNGCRISVGAAGPYRSTLSTQPWMDVTINGGSRTQLNAVAASQLAAVAVGSSGTILRAVPPSAAPTLSQVARPGGDVYVGQSVTLRASFADAGAWPRTFQWFHGGVAIPGATGASLALVNLRLSDAGAYSVAVSNAYGTATNSTDVVVRLSRPSGGIVDSTFSSPVTATPSAIAVQPDGRIVVAAPMFFYPGDEPQYGLGRLNPDGSLDPTFRVAAGGLGFDSWVSRIEIERHGHIVLSGLINSVAGVTPSWGGGCRLDSNGALDPAPMHPGTLTLDDGRKIEITLVRNVATITRLTYDGSVDASFPATSVSLATPSRGGVFEPS